MGHFPSGGSSSGPGPSTTVVGPDTYGAPSAPGTASTYSRGDHDHGLPATPADLPLAGGTMSGAIAMGSHKITGLANGTVSTDAAAFGQIPTSYTIRISQTYSVSGALAVPSGATNFLPPFFMPVPSGQTCKLVGVTAAIRGGTSVTLSVDQNGFAVSGLGSLSVTPTAGFTAATTPPSVSDGDAFAPVISAITGSPDGLSLSFYFDVTV